MNATDYFQAFVEKFGSEIDYSKFGESRTIGKWYVDFAGWTYMWLVYEQYINPTSQCSTGHVRIVIKGSRDADHKKFYPSSAEFHCNVYNGIWRGMYSIPNSLAEESLNATPAPKKTIAKLVMWDSKFPSEAKVGQPVDIKIGIVNEGDKDGAIHLKILANDITYATDSVYFPAKLEKSIKKTIIFDKIGNYDMTVKVWGEDETEP